MDGQPGIPEEQAEVQQPVVTVGQWLKLYSWLFLLFIPFVGWVAIIVVYFVKLTNPGTPGEIRNFLKACGAYLLISIAIGVVVSFVFYHTLWPALVDYLNEMLPETYRYTL